MKKLFDVDKFIHFMSSKNRKILTKDISDWLECPVRVVQNWGKRNTVPFYRIRNIKYYIWDKKTIEMFGKWYNRKPNKKPEKKPIPKSKKEPKPEKIIPFTTIKDIIDEVELNGKRRTSGSTKESRIRYIQQWCKKNEIPSVYINGRKYYRITPEIKSQIIGSFSKFRYLSDLFKSPFSLT